MNTREEWLIDAVALLRPLIGFDGEVRVSTGWPSVGGTRKKGKRIGECWKPQAAKDGVPHIFISPILEEPVIVLSTLLHELIHAKYPEAKHKGAFVMEARSAGLVAPWTATMPSDDLIEKLKGVASMLGDYNHSALVPTAQENKQSTRMLKVICNDSGYLVRMTRKWVDEWGTPVCPCHNNRMELE